MFFRKRKQTVRDRLDAVLFNWTEHDPLTVRHILNGGVAILGRSGSGKTSSSGKVLGRAVVRLGNSGGLILSAKPEDLPMWSSIFEQAGRKDDLIVFGPDKHYRFNILDYALKMFGHTREITKTITVIGETLRASDTNASENADFWQREQERLIYNAVEVVKLATGRVHAPDIQKFITGAAQNAQQLKDEDWRKDFHCELIRRAAARQKSAMEEQDFGQAVDYWLAEFPTMADKTRSSITTGVMGILHVFNTGIVRELMSTATNVSPDNMFDGKWVLVNMPPAEWGDIGSFVAGAWKYMTQRCNLRRHAGPADGINVIWCDEAQQFVNSYDHHYLAQCRSHLGCMVYLTQSLHSYYSALSGQSGKHQADALLTNFHHKLFHALGDVQTAEWASGLIGKSLQTFVGGSMAPSADVWDELAGRSQYTGNFSEHFENELQNNVFLNGLRTGGLVNGLVCDAVVIRSGEPFAWGGNYLFVPLSQR
jgi:type IV secretory pathway TraG/TraD family ATPase VirD4